jgi:hypothetical protein
MKQTVPSELGDFHRRNRWAIIGNSNAIWQSQKTIAPTKWQRIGNPINTAIVPAGSIS